MYADLFLLYETHLYVLVRILQGAAVQATDSHPRNIRRTPFLSEKKITGFYY